MKIRYKNSGTYPSWGLDGTMLTLGGALHLNLPALAKDTPAHYVISADPDGKLALGIGWRYAAELDLPAKQYAIEKIGYTDDYGYPALRKVALPYTAEDAVLTLWAKKEER